MYLVKKIQNLKGYWLILCIILIIFIFSGCAAKKDPETSNVDNPSAAPMNNQPKIEENIDEGLKDDSRVINTIAFTNYENSAEVLISGNKELRYTSIMQSFPFGIAIYLPGTKINKGVASILPEPGEISNIIASYADKEETTAKIEILLNKDLSYNIKKEKNNLRVIVSNAASNNQKQNPKKGSIKSSTKQENERVANNKPVKIPKGIAILNTIEFNTEDDGHTSLVLNLSHPIKYDFSKDKNNNGVFYLNLYKTNIPKRHKRPFETKFFKSAVWRVLPIQKTENGKNSKIQISLREKVPYEVVQNQNQLFINFEPSSIEPPKFTKADKTDKSKVNALVTKAPASMQEEQQHYAAKQLPINTQQPKSEKVQTKTSQQSNKTKINIRQKEQPKNDQIEGINTQGIHNQLKKTYSSKTDEKKYTGEKIKLDFYETDIKNVFRILSSISGKNLAIDKDVTGQVTLNLDNPIPWDQVLDLILRMNGLGKIEEGNVIRIATQKTLAKEQIDLQAKLKAKRAANEAQAKLLPLFTEYIPINYASAKNDIAPHIKKLLTKQRGVLSVDSRTNMIILTDTKTVITKALRLIYSLDRVTPQIMIEAKIVEANDDFSRELGLNINFGFGEKPVTDTTTQIDGFKEDNIATHGYDNHWVSLNQPAGTFSNFTINNLIGTLGGGTAFLNMQLAAEEVKNNVKIISSPKILTLDNKKAVIKQGIDYPFLERDDTGGATIKYKQIVLKLEVTPHVTPDKRISMKISVSKNEISGFRAGVPSLSINTAETELLVNDNDTIVIGGVLKEREGKEERGVPYLKNIPFLGRLFRTDQDKLDKQELLIFLTPTIVQLKQRNILSDKDTLQP